MNTVNLYFASLEKPELVLFEFENSHGEKRSSVRGKTGFLTDGAYSYQWTSAVKACSLLFLTATIHGIDESNISGEVNSLASAFDYALSKPPIWLVEMFGLDGAGSSRTKKLFKRINPERKRPGPVIIKLNSTQFESSSINIFIGGVRLQSQKELSAFYEYFSKSLKVYEDAFIIDQEILAAPSTKLKNEEDNFLLKIYKEEIYTSLVSSKIFSKKWNQSKLESLNKNELFNKINSPHPDSLNALVDKLSSSKRLLLTEKDNIKYFQDTKPIKVVTSVLAAGLIALCKYLKHYLHVPIELQIYFPYGLDAVDYSKLFVGDTSYVVCCTGLGPTAEFFSNPKSGYTPLMFGPSMSHRIVTSNQDREAEDQNGDFLFVIETPTSAMFAFDSLVKASKLKLDNLDIKHCEPEDTVLSLFENPNSKSLMWFPHYNLLSYYAGLNILEPNHTDYTQPNIMFANEALTRDKALLERTQTLFKQAWISLLEDRNMIEQVSKIILSDKKYVKYLKRCAGLHYLGDVQGAKFSDQDVFL